MDRIPTELFHEVFIKLALKDRLECMLVCHSWRNRLDKSSLLYDLNITSTQYHKLNDVIKRFPHRANQTENLTFRLCYKDNIDKKQLYNMFPNLRVLLLKEFDNLKNQSHTTGQFRFMNPTSKLERLAEDGEYELTRQLLISNMCNRLKSLELGHICYYYSDNSFSITQLKSMPVLENLRLNQPTATLMDLEIMHHNLPSLKSLYIKVRIVSGQVPRVTIPATLITTLHMAIDADTEDLNTHILFYKYIYNKYPSVNNPIFDDYEMLEKNMAYVRDLYNEGIFPMYQNISSQVDTISFGNYYDELDAFRKLDAFGVKLKNLTIEAFFDELQEHAVLPLGDLTQSQQSKSITCLTLKDITPEPIHWFNKMETLTYLDISTSYGSDNLNLGLIRTIDFCQLIEACPATLSSLFLSGLSLQCDGSTSNQTGIRCLDLYYMDLDQHLAKVIETSFPKLSHFTFEGEMHRDVTISLPEHGLDSVDITFYYHQISFNGFIITTAEFDEPEYYGTAETEVYDWDGRYRDYGDVVCLPKEKFDGCPVLRLTCAYIEKLSLKVEKDFYF